MTIERDRKFFGFKASSKKLVPGEVYEITRGRGFFSGKIDKWEFEVLNPDMIRLRISTAVYGSFGLTYNETLCPIESLLFREEINTENIHGSAFLGAKEKIIWKPNK